MGGNAIKKVKVSRFSLSKYFSISRDILDKLTEANIKSLRPFFVPDKISFGDIDILVENKEDIDLKEWIIKTFNPIEIVSNGVYSIAYTENQLDENGEIIYYQVDFIPVKHIEAAMFFYSYGDVGAIIGKFVGYNGISFSENGIYIKVRSELLGIESKDHTYVYDKINISTDPQEICKILGFDYMKWLNIISVEELFEWILSSHYYTIDAFKFIAMDKRKRLSLRPLYISFLEKIGITDFDNINNKIINKEIIEHQKYILEKYGKINELEPIRERIRLEKERKEKFNANVFINNGIEKLKLSNTMSEFKKTILDIKFEDWLDKHTKEQIDNTIISFIHK